MLIAGLGRNLYYPLQISCNLLSVTRITVEQVDEEFDRLSAESKARGTEKKLMDMPWECKACRMEGSENYLKPMYEFNVRSNYEFLTRLLPQGAWARCVRCNKRRHGQLGCAMSEAHRNAASQAMATCKKCAHPLPRTAFWEDDWRHLHQGISCKACEPLAPSSRRGSLIKCKRCGLDLDRKMFRPAHIRKHGIRKCVCVTCLQAPPA